jgi:NADH-quinone oxidoreductase subunit N
MGVCMVIFLFSLIGIPGTVGFTGKYLLFASVLESHYIWLAVVGVLNSVVSLYYYAKIFRNMFLRGIDKEREPLNISIQSQVFAYLLAIPVIFYGLYWNPILNWAKNSIMLFVK